MDYTDEEMVRTLPCCNYIINTNIQYIIFIVNVLIFGQLKVESAQYAKLDATNILTIDYF